MEKNHFDTIIIGGSYAGLAAAMSLGRSIRKTLVIDGGKPCNQQTPHAHNFLTQDGSTPASIRSLALEQVLAYPTVQFINDKVSDVRGENLQFHVLTVSGEQFESKKVLFATGIEDKIPAIDGFADCWGISVIHCPYCHGYEYREKPTGLLISGDLALERGRLIRNWTKDLTIFTNGNGIINKEHKENFAAKGINVIEIPLRKIEHHNGYLERLVLSDNTEVVLTALYAHLPFVQHCLLPERLGCALNETGHIQVDSFQRTTVPGIYAAGDNTTMFRSVAAAVAAGTMAGALINHDLIAEDN